MNPKPLLASTTLLAALCGSTVALATGFLACSPAMAAGSMEHLAAMVQAAITANSGDLPQSGLPARVAMDGESRKGAGENTPKRDPISLEKSPSQDRRVRGIVIDDKGQAVAGAAIDVPDAHRSTTSDGVGRFSLSLPLGMHALHVWRIDHERVKKTVVVTATGELDPLFVRLRRRDLRLAPIVVSAARHEKPEKNLGHHVLLAQDMEEQIGGMEDVMRSVQSLPSVGTASDFHGEFFVRGSGTHANAVYLDGVPIFFPYHILGFNSIFNAGIVESAEFYSGGVPAAYGGATGGVLLVRSRGASPSPGRGDAGLSYVSAHLRADGGDARRGWALSLRRSYHDQVVRLVDPSNNSQIPSFYDAMFRGRWKPSEKHSLVAGLLLAGDGLSINSPEASALRHDIIQDGDGTAATEVAQSTTPDRLGLNNSMAVGSLNWRALLGPDAWLETTAGYVPQRLSFSLKGEDNESVSIQSRTVSLRQDLMLRRQEHKLRFGYEMYRSHTQGVVSAYAAFLNLRQSNLALNVNDQKEHYLLDLDRSRAFGALYVQDDWASDGGRFELGGGLRFERDALAGQSMMSPRVSTTYHPMAAWSLQASWGVSHALRSTPLEVQPSQDGRPLEAERAIEASLGLSRRTALLRAGVSGYVKQLDNLVYEIEPAYYANGGIGRSHGLETWMEFTPGHGGFQARLQYAWSKTQQLDGIDWRRRLTVDPVTGQSVWGAVYESPRWYSPIQDQRHRLSLDTRFTMRAWEFGAKLQVASGLPYTPVATVARDAEGQAYGVVGDKGSARLPLYSRLDLRLLRNFQGKTVHWRVIAEVLNATAADNVYMKRWNQEYTQQYSIIMLPLLPTLGVEASF